MTPDPNTSAETVQRMKALDYKPYRRTKDKLVTGYILLKGDVLPAYAIFRSPQRRWWVGICTRLAANKYLSFTRMTAIEPFDTPEAAALWLILEKANG